LPASVLWLECAHDLFSLALANFRRGIFGFVSRSFKKEQPTPYSTLALYGSLTLANSLFRLSILWH
jgi:hypothetical protein